MDTDQTGFRRPLKLWEYPQCREKQLLDSVPDDPEQDQA